MTQEQPPSFGFDDAALAALPLAYQPGLFDGQVVMVSGAGSGIGKAIAFLYARLGARLVICGRDRAKLDACEPWLRRLGSPDVLVQPTDIRRTEAIAALFDAAYQRFGRVDVLVNNAGGQFPKAALDIIERERCVNVMGWPSLVNAMLGDPSYAGRDLSFCPPLSGVPIPLPEPPKPGALGHRSMSELVGNWGGSERKAINPETGETVADLEEGELVVRGWGALQGYYKKEREETFDADGWYHTGDRVYRRPDDPRLFYVGRTTELIKSAGANVSPLEVEAVLTEREDIAQCVVLGIDHVERGEEVCAVIVPASEHLDLEAVAVHTRDRLSSYKVPTRWVLISSTDIPTLPSGKLDRKTLRALIADGTLG